MSNKDENKIRELFSPMASMSIADNDAWGQFQSRVKWSNFYSFGFTHFNIYYAVLAGLFSISGVSYTVHKYVLTGSKTETKQNILIENNDNVENKDRNNTINALEYRESEIIENSKKDPVSIQSPEINKSNPSDISSTGNKSVDLQSPVQNNLVFSVDSVEENALNRNELPVSNQEKKPVKTIKSNKSIIIEETFDTITKIDTQYVEKKRLFGR